MKRLIPGGLTANSFLTCVVVLAFMSGAFGQETEKRMRTITVGGEGLVTAAPDEATVRFNVVTRNDDPEQARAANARASKTAMDSIRDLGVPEDKIRLDQLTLMPVKEWDPEQRKQIEVGFEVNRGVTVELNDLDLVPTVVTRVVQGGANRIGGVSYQLSDDIEVRTRALSRAVEHARSKATAMLETLGETVGKVVEVREQSMQTPYPVMRSLSAVSAEKADAPVPEAYAPGRIEIRAEVVVTFEIQ